jgi:hypothetical protein
MILCFLLLSLLRPITSQSTTKDSSYVPKFPCKSESGIYIYINMYVYKKGPSGKRTSTHWNAMGSSMTAPLSVLSPNSVHHQVLSLYTLLKLLISEIV